MAGPCTRHCYRSEIGGPDPLWDARAEIERLRAALEACRQHVRTHHSASGGWWNDQAVYNLIREHIDPALTVNTPSRIDEQKADR